jgi:hypothetical protein
LGWARASAGMAQAAPWTEPSPEVLLEISHDFARCRSFALL